MRSVFSTPLMWLLVAAAPILCRAQEQEPPRAVARTERTTEEGDTIIQVIEDDRMIRISERDAGITVTVVETVRGVDKTSRYFARSLEQLKAKEPQAFDLYERYRQATSLDGPSEFKDAAMDNPQRDIDAMIRERLLEYQRQFANNAQMMQLLNSMQRQMTQQANANRYSAFPAQFPAQFSGGIANAQASAQAQAQASAQARAQAQATVSGSTGGSSLQQGRTTGRATSPGASSSGGGRARINR